MASDAKKVSVEDARQEVARGTPWPSTSARRRSGARATSPERSISRSLSARGYDAVAVDGGMDDWASNFNTQPTEDPDEDTELGLS
jgi:hypothetical protein